MAAGRAAAEERCAGGGGVPGQLTRLRGMAAGRAAAEELWPLEVGRADLAAAWPGRLARLGCAGWPPGGPPRRSGVPGAVACPGGWLGCADGRRAAGRLA